MTNKLKYDELNQCAICNAKFTEEECEDGALTEVSITTYEKGHDKSDLERYVEVHGYDLRCDDCYLRSEDCY